MLSTRARARVPPLAAPAEDAVADGHAAVVEEAARGAEAGEQRAQEEQGEHAQDEQEPPGHAALAKDVCQGGGRLPGVTEGRRRTARRDFWTRKRNEKKNCDVYCAVFQ